MNGSKNTKNVHAVIFSTTAVVVLIACLLTTSSLIKHKSLIVHYLNALSSQTTPMMIAK